MQHLQYYAKCVQLSAVLFMVGFWHFLEGSFFGDLLGNQWRDSTELLSVMIKVWHEFLIVSCF
jgi:hypothetical protein